MLTPDLINDPRTFTTRYTDVPVLITDKRIYYSEEAETILRTAMEAGHDSVVVVARDFIGSSVNVFLANHTKKINILLVKDPHAKENDSTSLDDLATYLGGKVITEKSGSLVNKLKEDDFVIADKVFADGGKTLLTSKEKINPGLQERVKGLKDELKKDPENDRLKKRISSLTNGMVTIKVGANTPLELRERMYRYEDAINATKNAMKFGYLPGGGIALADAFKSADNPQLDSVYKRYCESSLRQLATNCGKHPDSLIENVKALPVGQGYNALTDEYGDMVKFGIIDPFKVTEMAIKSSVSIANAILSAGYLIIDNKEEKE
jgi:chaperonin GroEL